MWRSGVLTTCTRSRSATSARYRSPALGLALPAHVLSCRLPLNGDGAVCCLACRYFRFRKDDMPLLLQELDVPTNRWGMVEVGNGYSFQPMEALCTFLLRMSTSANNWDRLLPIMGGASTSRYQRAFYYMLDHIYDTFKGCVDDITRWAADADVWADAIHAAGAPAPRCISFIDGTFRPCCRPVRGQRQIYWGYKKLHGLKFQSVIAPNGLIVDLFGAIVGRRSDSYMLTRSDLLTRMAQLVGLAGAPYYLYGDPAYPLSMYILRGYKGAMTAAQRAFSTEMSRLRGSVEWGFSLVIADWTYVDYKKNLKLLQQPIGKMYFVACLLTNMKTCMTASHAFDGYGNEIALKFRVSPPSLHDYLYPS